MKKLLRLIFLAPLFFIAVTAKAQEPQGIFLNNITTAELLKIYEKNNYKDYIYIEKWRYPAIFLDNLPTDFQTLEDESLRNRIFLMIVGPLALKINEEIIEERSQIVDIQEYFLKNKELTPEQEAIIEEKAKKYDIFTRLKGYRRHQYLLNELILNVDMVSPSILMAMAAIKTDWGTSRLSHQANSLYKEMVFFSDEGIKPEKVGEDSNNDDSYRFKVFPNLLSSMRSYALKINSNINYYQFRKMRESLRYREKPFLGRSLAHLMFFDTKLENIAGLLDYTITFYELTNWDEALLNYNNLKM